MQFGSRYNTTKAKDKQKNHRDKNRVFRMSIEGEYVYLNQQRKQTDVKYIEK
jgi:hypothetical protein